VELSFHFHDEFIKDYATKNVNWGYKDLAGNSIGEITFYRTYSRRKENGSKERWHEVCQRVIEGMYSILKDHCRENRLPWNEKKAQNSATEAYDRMFNFKWLPPGRGLWMMGTPFVHERHNSAALQNCSFVSTNDMTKFHPETPFTFLMEASMLGVGVGFDTEGAKKDFTIYKPDDVMNVLADSEPIIIEDSREGWVESTAVILRSYLVPNQQRPKFNYDIIRPAGEPIHGFGGVAAGAGPLIDLHNSLSKMFVGREGETLTSRDIVDIANHIGRCVVAGNVRRSAELALGDADDDEFLNLKNYTENPERAEFGWVSNNSIKVAVGEQDYDKYTDRVVENGEPGFIYMDVTRAYGRLIDPPNNKDHRAMGFNPCAEQPLESYEMCTLVEAFPTKHEDKADFLRTLKFAYMYGKAVTLIPTHWPETNAVMQRNRRIGLSISGLAEFVETNNWTELRSWMNEGYAEVQSWDNVYSDWLGVRESIKTTTVKPSGSVSLLVGTTPGAHWPTNDTYIRRMRLGSNDPLTKSLIEAGYNVEPAFGNEETTSVVEIPIQGKGIRTEKEVSIFEKMQLAVLAQRYWSDNGVSLTVTFDPDTEGQKVGDVLRMYEGQLKAVSFLPIKDNAYPQMPYEAITSDELEEKSTDLKKLKWNKLYKSGIEAQGEKFCTTDACEIPLGLDTGTNL